MEFVVVFLFLVTGLTLNKIPKGEYYRDDQQAPSRQSEAPIQNQYAGPAPVRQQKSDNMILKIAKATIIGRIITAAIPSKERDVEMQQQQYRR